MNACEFLPQHDNSNTANVHGTAAIFSFKYQEMFLRPLLL